MRQPGVEIRPITQLTGTSEFNEVFFDGARTDPANVVGSPGDGWRVAMATLGFERGVATLGQQVGFLRELKGVVASAQANGSIDDPDIRDRIVDAWVDLSVLRFSALRMLGNPVPGAEASISKLMWSTWHQRLGELAIEVAGPAAMYVADRPEDLDDAQQLYLFSRADTIYGGSSEIQRGIVAERLLGMPRG